MERSEEEKLEEMVDDIVHERMNMHNPNKKKSDDIIAHQRAEECPKSSNHAKSIEHIVKERALPFLPAKTLCRFKTVSKEWDQWIKNPFFSHSQSNHFQDVSGFFFQIPGEIPSFISLDPNSFGVPSNSLSFLPENDIDIRSTCNGLLCCQSRDRHEAYYVCNPVTKDWRRLPKPSLYHPPGTAIALAFEPSVLNFSANYELICVVNLPESPVLHFEMYSSRSNSWRISETICCEPDVLALNNDGHYSKGFAYWETKYGAILVFHVRTEYFGILSLPICSGPTGALTERHRDLCYIMPRKIEEDYIVEVYGDMNMTLKEVIKLNPQVSASIIAGRLMCRAVCLVDDDTLILDLGGKIISYNAKTMQVKCIQDGSRANGFGKLLPYVNTLVHVVHSSLSQYLG